MTAILTYGDNVVEAQLVNNGVTVATRYFDTENQAIDFIDENGVVDIKLSY